MEMPRLPRMPAAVVYGVGCSSQLLLWLCATVNKAWSFDGIYNGGLLLPTKKCDPCNPLINFWTVWHHVMCEFRLKGVFFMFQIIPPGPSLRMELMQKTRLLDCTRLSQTRWAALRLHFFCTLCCSSISLSLLTLPEYLTDHSHFASVSHQPLSFCVNVVSLTTLSLYLKCSSISSLTVH